MERYKYEVTVEEAEAPNPHKKGLTVECRENYVAISLRGDPDNAAIVAFYDNGGVKLYSGTARAAGFKPEML